jgi:O-antigen/teichoic acid export membrane protein
MEEGSLGAPPPASGVPVQRMMRNAAFLVVAQVLGMPLSLLQSALVARYLGATAVGYMYIAITFNAFAFMAVDWGQSGALPALVATSRERAGELLGSALVWRASTSVVASAALLVVSYLLGYDRQVLTAIAVVSIGFAFSHISDGCQYAIFGFERTDVGARRQVIEQLLTVIIVGPILVLGGTLNASLTAGAVVCVIVFAYVWRTLRPAGISRLSFRRETLGLLLKQGTPFVFLGSALFLQPYIDTLFLSKLAPDAVGWHAAARKLMGVLVFPATVLRGAMYPTMCRLYGTDPTGFRQATSAALRSASLLVFPAALGCALYPEVGIAIFSRRSFGPAEDNLRILSLFLFLMYFSMPIGNCLLAAGRQRVWAVVQSLCIVVSLIGDPLLVPWFERHTGNGGLGVCWTTVFSEVVVVALGVMLMPGGIFDRRFWRSLGLAAVSGLAMAAAARALRPVSPFVAAPLAVIVYGGALWLTGGIEKSQVEAVRDLLNRKLSRGAATPSVSPP